MLLDFAILCYCSYNVINYKTHRCYSISNSNDFCIRASASVEESASSSKTKSHNAIEYSISNSKMFYASFSKSRNSL